MADGICEFHINNEGRIIRLEERVGAVEGKVAANHVEQVSRIDEVLTFFRARDDLFIKNMWRVTFGLLGLMATILLTLIGLKELPKLF